MSKMILFITLAIVFVSFESSADQRVHSGDLVFVSLSCYQCDLIEKTTHSPYSHVGIIEVVDNFRWVIMAAPPAVVRIPLEKLLFSARRPPVVMRLKPGYKDVADLAVRWAKSYLGRPYDKGFVWGDGELYCAELVYFAFNNAASRLGYREVFTPHLMSFKPFTLEWVSALGFPPPEGKIGINPGILSRSLALYEIQ